MTGKQSNSTILTKKGTPLRKKKKPHNKNVPSQTFNYTDQKKCQCCGTTTKRRHCSS